jgi:hypothetical protein
VRRCSFAESEAVLRGVLLLEVDIGCVVYCCWRLKPFAELVGVEVEVGVALFTLCVTKRGLNEEHKAGFLRQKLMG